MSEQVVKRFEDLINAGTQLVPLGGFEFSGYNARLQNKYLEWRKACLEMLEAAGPIGFPYKSRVLADQNGGFFFQSSAQLILNAMRELYEKLKSAPDLAAAPAPQASAPPAPAPAVDNSGVRILKPPPKPAAPASQAPAATSAPMAAGTAKSNKVFVVTDVDDPLHAQLSQFLSDIGVEEIVLTRAEGQMLALDAIPEVSDVRFAFFVLNSSDLSYVMFEVGHFVGKLGKGNVCVVHMSDVNFPKNIPGVSIKPIVVKLEEASFGLIKELKAAGYAVSI